eukprot:3966636-Amphidinium_carterae.1
MADPITMSYASNTDFLQEAKQVGSAPAQVATGLGRSVVVTMSDATNPSTSLHTLSDYDDLLECAGLKFKWYAYLSAAVGQQVVDMHLSDASTSSAKLANVAHSEETPLGRLLVHFSPWLLRSMHGTCKGRATISVAPQLSSTAHEAPLLLCNVSLPCPLSQSAAPRRADAFLTLAREAR